jgi:activator of Hsp90 ATPase-like protein
MDIVFRFDTDASAVTVLDAVKTTDGIKGFWTSRAEVPAEVGESLSLEFPVAPMPFDLRLEQSDERTVVWRTGSFPPHWVGTTVRWDVEPNDEGSTVTFRHAGLPDDDETGRVAYTWGQIMIQLKEYAETGRPDPVFA